MQAGIAWERPDGVIVPSEIMERAVRVAINLNNAGCLANIITVRLDLRARVAGLDLDLIENGALGTALRTGIDWSIDTTHEQEQCGYRRKRTDIVFIHFTNGSLEELLRQVGKLYPAGNALFLPREISLSPFGPGYFAPAIGA